MNKKPNTVERSSSETSSIVDVLEMMLKRPETRALMAEPGVRVIQARNQNTGRVTYSFRSVDDTSSDDLEANSV